MNEVLFGCDLQYEIVSPTTFLFQIGVAQTDSQVCKNEMLTTYPMVDIQQFKMGIEENRVHRVVLMPCNFSLHYEGVVQLDAEIDPPAELLEQPYRELPPSVLPYLNPSRFCESDLLGNFATSEFGALPQGYSRVKAICDWTYKHLKYVSGVTNSQTTARDVLVLRQGVCRDFAHLAISLCRGLNIPARYVAGYAVNLNPPDFHGFFEAYLGERWYLFDPTRLAPVAGLVRIGCGQDAANVPFASLLGCATLKSKNVWANASNTAAILPSSNEAAVSTA
jgi:transglutaminase-like putative cysteine protease